jgi:hypothetical protein
LREWGLHLLYASDRPLLHRQEVMMELPTAGVGLHHLRVEVKGGAVRKVTPPLVQIGMSLVLGSLQVEEAVALRMEGVALQVEEGVVHQVEEAFLHLVVVVGALLAVEVAHQVVVADGVVVQVADVVYLLEAPPE